MFFNSRTPRIFHPRRRRGRDARARARAAVPRAGTRARARAGAGGRRPGGRRPGPFAYLPSCPDSFRAALVMAGVRASSVWSVERSHEAHSCIQSKSWLFGVTHELYVAGKGTPPYFLHTSDMVLRIRATFSVFRLGASMHSGSSSLSLLWFLDRQSMPGQRTHLTSPHVFSCAGCGADAKRPHGPLRGQR